MCVHLKQVCVCVIQIPQLTFPRTLYSWPWQLPGISLFFKFNQIFVHRTDSISGCFSRTRFKCSHMVVKTLLYRTRKCGCKAGCKSARCFVPPPCNGSAGQPSRWNTPWNKLFHKNTAFASSFERGGERRVFME